MTTSSRLKKNFDASRRFGKSFLPRSYFITSVSKILWLYHFTIAYLSLGPCEHDTADNFHNVTLEVKSDSYYNDIGYGNIENLLEENDIIISVEHCCNCEHHNGLSLRHDAKKCNPFFSFFSYSISSLKLSSNYAPLDLDMARKMLQFCTKLVHSCSLNLRVGVALLPLVSDSRIGAFEVAAIQRGRIGKPISRVLHSKLETGNAPL